MVSEVMLLYFLVLLSSLLSVYKCQLSCMDESQQPVDWFIALKYPKSFDFVYLSPKYDQWKSSSFNLSSGSNMVGLTIEQSYNPLYFYAYYNDEHPVLHGTYSERGHLKGVLNFGKSSGYWLIHSVPKFPTEGMYKYESGEETFAQSFICVSVSTTNLGSFVQQLLMMQSTVYSHNIPQDFSQDMTLMLNLNKFVRNKNGNITQSNVFKFITLGQNPFIHLGKSNIFDNDLYDGLIAPSLKTSIYVESWIRGDRIDSSCQLQYKVYNVKEVNLVKTSFKESSDHSKWAVSTSDNAPFVCIGDINRMTSQFKRGGGSLCVASTDIWNTFHLLVADFERCQ